jgi:hypothetical protein
MRSKRSRPVRAPPDHAISAQTALPLEAGPTIPESNAFSLWLRSSLHQAYDDVAAEPVPKELLELLRRDDTGRLG